MPRRSDDGTSPPISLPTRFHQRRVVNLSTTTEEYKGYLPENDALPSIESIENLDKESLWYKYISCRKPVVIDGLVRDKGWEGERWKDLSFLRRIAGSTMVKIEPVDEIKDQFGTGSKRKEVTLSHFLDMLEDPKMAGKWYMTTQYEEEEEEEEEEEKEKKGREKEEVVESDDSKSDDAVPTTLSNGEGGHFQDQSEKDESKGFVKIDERLLPKVDVDVSLPPPTDALAHLFPLPGPEIMGNLVLQQCNLWMGNGVSGKSSGLHHDFHDNLYMLLSGRKRFLIWPPLAHRWLEPVGKIDTVHSNGLIEYDEPGHEQLQADGLTRRESLKWLFRARLRALLEADEKAARQTGEEHVLKGLRKGKGKQTNEQENALEWLKEAERELLVLQMEEEDSDSELLSTASSLDTCSDLFEREWDTDDEDEDEDEEDDEDEKTTDEKTKESDFEEGYLDVPIARPKSDKRSKKKKRSPDESISRTDSEEDEEANIVNRTKRQKRNQDKLIIPAGGLPGGLRGSLQDLEGDLDDESDEFADEDDEGANDLYLAQPEDGDIDDEESLLVTMEMRSTVLARMRAMAEEVIASEDEEESGLEVEGDEGSSREEGTDDDLPLHAEYKDDEANSDDSWPTMDEDAFEDGEAELEKLARLQDENEGVSTSHKATYKGDDDDPKSFSKISPRVMQWYFDKPFDPAVNQPPQLKDERNTVHLLPRKGCPQPIDIHLQAGQMLYLPASWYHEVTSYTDPTEESGVHMALNYWFHPPTAIRRPKDEVKVPTRGGSGAAKQAVCDWSKPYLDFEVWDEIRRSVNEKVDTIRKRAENQAAANEGF